MIFYVVALIQVGLFWHAMAKTNSATSISPSLSVELKECNDAVNNSPRLSGVVGRSLRVDPRYAAFLYQLDIGRSQLLATNSQPNDTLLEDVRGGLSGQMATLRDIELVYVEFQLDGRMPHWLYKNSAVDIDRNYYGRLANLRGNRQTVAFIHKCSLVIVLYPTAWIENRVTAALVVRIPAKAFDFDECQDVSLHLCPTQLLQTGVREPSKCHFVGANRGFDATSARYQCCCADLSVGCIPGVELRKEPSVNRSHFCQTRSDLAKERSSLALVFLCINAFCAIVSVTLVLLIVRQRKTQQYGVRGWALMELFAIGATFLYLIVVVEFFQPSIAVCCMAVWLREMGFALFYGSIVLKIYRNFVEYRVRKAHRVYVKEADMLKYIGCISALTFTGLLAWTLAQVQSGDPTASFLVPARVAIQPERTRAYRPPPPLCRLQYWGHAWHLYELLFLIWGMRLCYKARNSSWNEKWNFTIAVAVEAGVTLVANLVRVVVHLSRDGGDDSGDTFATPQMMQIISLIHIHSTVTIVVCLVLAPKFYYVRRDPNRAPGAGTTGASGKAHPSLAKLRDNLVNGTIDFAEVPIIDMNPEDIRAELKRVYTQLRMFKLKGQYQDNPHILTKRKKNKSDRGKESTGSVPTSAAVAAPSSASKPSGSCSSPTAITPLTAVINRQPSPLIKARNELYRVEEDEGSSMLDSGATSSPQASGPAHIGATTTTLTTTDQQLDVKPDTDPPSLASLNADITVESSPHNVYLSSTSVAAHTKKYQLESDQSVRV